MHKENYLFSNEAQDNLEDFELDDGDEFENEHEYMPPLRGKKLRSLIFFFSIISFFIIIILGGEAMGLYTTGSIIRDPYARTLL